MKLATTSTPLTQHSISSLAPRILTEEKDLLKVRPYLERLQKALNSSGITNVALTGNYGSGKSTIIGTYFHQHPEIKHLKVSLASFNPDTKASEELERRLEVSILQQLFYHVHPRRIPDSRFKRIVNLSDQRLVLIGLGSILWLISSFALFKFDYLKKLNPANWDFNLHLDIWTIVFALIFFAGVGLFSKAVARLVANSRINKLTIKGEVELGEDVDKSVFNQHLEEIIYFFERTDYQVVVIEDLDRFNNTEIFTKLREINILLNNAESIGREIVFLYAIRDEMFTDKKDRVKFFDYIIPVISFISTSNAGEQLTELVRNANMDKTLSKDFREDIMTFIDDIDMRLLINIFNEYQVYNETLKDSSLNQDELFAVVIYKNLYPDDFGELTKRQGKLYKFLSAKPDYLAIASKELQDLITDIESDVTNIEQEPLTAIAELRRIYIHGFLSRHPEATAFVIDEKTISFSNILEDEYFNELRESKRITYTYSRGYSTENKTIDNPFGTIEKEIDSNQTYDQREFNMQSRSNGKLDELHKSKKKLKQEMQLVQASSLKEIFSKIDISPFLESFPNDDLIRNLLVNGYLNEQYQDYISLFHDVNLTREDFHFERKVRSGIHLDYDYELKNVENLVAKIRLDYFERDVILNTHLFDYLLGSFEFHLDKRKAVLKLLSNERDRSIGFIYNYISNGKEIHLFIKGLCASWPGLWNYVGNNFTEEDAKHMLKLIIKYADVRDIQQFSKGTDIAKYSERYYEFITAFKDISPDTVALFLRGLNVKFEEVERVNKEVPLLKLIYKNCNYRITIKNLELMITTFGISSGKGTISPTFTVIENSGCNHLISYVSHNINEYINEVYQHLPEVVIEDEGILIKLLNKKELNPTHRASIISRQKNALSDITGIDELIVQHELFLLNRIVPNWENIFHYYAACSESIGEPSPGQDEHDEPENEVRDVAFEKIALSEELWAFFNIKANAVELSKKLISVEGNTNPLVDQFLREITLSKVISQNTYEILVNSFPYSLDMLGIPFEQLSPDRIKTIINSGLIGLSSELYDLLKVNYTGLHIDLLVRNADEIEELFDELDLETEDVVALLKTNFSESKHFGDVLHLLSDEILMNEVISSLVTNLWPDTKLRELSYSVLTIMLSSGAYTHQKLKVLNQYILQLQNYEILALTSLIGPEYEKLFKKQHKPTFENSVEHQTLFNELKKRNMIKRFGLDEKKNLIKVFANY